MLPVLAALVAQAPPADLTQRITAAHALVRQLAPQFADSVWPGFRPDTVPVLYVVPEIGTFLLGWRGDLPAGFAPLAAAPGAGWQPVAARGAASTATTLAGRPTAQVVVTGNATAVELAGLTAHEAFHVFQSAVRRDGRRFGQGENSFLVSSYPVFDAANEAAVALEGRLLRAALESRDRTRQRELARQFVAAREARHRTLPGDYATFEQLGELNEGLAEYTLVRTRALSGDRDSGARTTAALDSLTHDVTRSMRLRFYVTGPAQARLLDALAGTDWKVRLLRDNLTLQDALAFASGARDAETAARRAAERAFGMAALRLQADEGLARLRALRRAQVDSLVGAAGVLLTIVLDSLPPGRVGLCMIDPQNLLQADAGVLLHTRAMRACAGSALDASFTTAVVHDRPGGSIRAVIGAADAVRVTSGGKPLALNEGEQTEAVDVRIETPTLTLRAARADLERRGRELSVRPKP
jgi:hypothetical protein